LRMGWPILFLERIAFCLDLLLADLGWSGAGIRVSGLESSQGNCQGPERKVPRWKVAALSLENGFIPGFYTGSDMYLESVGIQEGFRLTTLPFRRVPRILFSAFFGLGHALPCFRVRRLVLGGFPELRVTVRTCQCPVSPSISQNISSDSSFGWKNPDFTRKPSGVERPMVAIQPLDP